MGTKLTHASRTELADSSRQRYQSRSGKTKKLIFKRVHCQHRLSTEVRVTLTQRRAPGFA